MYQLAIDSVFYLAPIDALFKLPQVNQRDRLEVSRKWHATQ